MRLIYKLMFVLILLSSCKKYSEDGEIPFTTVKKRLTSSYWFLKEYLINGVNYTDSLYNITYGSKNNIQYTKCAFYNTRYLFKSNKSCTTNSEYELTTCNSCGIECSECERWVLKNKKNSIQITTSLFHTNANPNTWNLKNTNDWSIKKLTNDDLIIETVDLGGRLCRVSFTH